MRASDHDIGQVLHRGHNDVGLVWCPTERPSAPIDERGLHAGRFRADAIECVVCDEQHLVQAKAEQLRRLCIGRHVRLEGIGFRAGDDTIDRMPWCFSAVSSISGSPFDKTTSL